MKFMISQAELDEKLAQAVDATLLPLITELETLGVPKDTIILAMRRVVEREIADRDDNSAKG